MEHIHSSEALDAAVKQHSRLFLLLYRRGSELSQCALDAIEQLSGMAEDKLHMLAADVDSVRDIHPVYGITSVPALLLFENGEFVNVVKGCHDKAFYQALAENTLYQLLAASPGKKQKQVLVYSTPSCSWCNTLKGFLRKHHVAYTEIDVSRDEEAAREMVRKSGQQGVPQTDIEGTVIVGFDQKRIKELLEIQ